MQRALIEAVLLGVLGGIVGVHVVLRRLAFMADALTHTVFPGIAVAFLLGGSLYVGALVTGVAQRRAAHARSPATAGSPPTRRWPCCSPASSPSA